MFVCEVPLLNWTKNLRKCTKKSLGKYEYTCTSVWRECPAEATHHKCERSSGTKTKTICISEFDGVKHTGSGWLLMLTILPEQRMWCSSHFNTDIRPPQKWCSAVLGHFPLLLVFSSFKLCTTKTPAIVVLLTSCIAERSLPLEI